MAELHYMTNTSLDGYIEDATGDFQWTEPDDSVFRFITELARPYGTWLYGRRLYESMQVWETDASLAAESEMYAAFAQMWSAPDKVVYSTTLQDVVTERTRLERSFDVDEVREMKESADANLIIGGAHLAGHAFNAGLVDEIQFFVGPVAVGSGKPALMNESRLHLELVDEKRFDSGILYVRYRVKN